MGPPTPRSACAKEKGGRRSARRVDQRRGKDRAGRPVNSEHDTGKGSAMKNSTTLSPAKRAPRKIALIVPADAGTPGIPTVLAFTIGQPAGGMHEAIFWCPHCREWHFHGVDEEARVQ